MRLLTACFLIFSLAPGFFAQEPKVQEAEAERIVVKTNEVLLDAIVKDKKGRSVKDLKASDFAVFEDEVEQEISSFRLVKREPTTIEVAGTSESSASRTAGTSRPAAPLNTNHVSAVALVFDRLSPDARALARQAALTYLDEGWRGDDFVGVFGIDLAPRVLQPFTNNQQLVKQAIERGVSHSSSTYSSSTDQIAALATTQAALQDRLAQSPTGTGTGLEGASSGGTAVAEKFAAMTLQTLQGFERQERDQQGYASVDGLLAIITAMRRLPGRKALIFFSEGLATPASVITHFRSVISNANRANVSIYAVDAAGLRALSSDAQTGRALISLGQARLRQANSSFDPFGSMMRDLERNEDLMRLNPEGGLDQLATETGGLLISKTNNPGGRLRQVSEDLHTYYAITYQPKNQDFDGRFRQISVKLSRRDLEIQTRKGYYAVNAVYDMPVLAYEAPALAILSGTPQPNAFSSTVAAFSFPEADRLGLVPVIVEVPLSSISLTTSNEKKSVEVDFSVVVLIKDAGQRIVRKLSRQYLLTAPLDKVETTRRGNVVFYRETELEPGNYTVVSVVYDATARKASTNTTSILVPATTPAKLRLSSIALIRSAQRLPETNQQTPNPFHYGEVLIYPNPGQPLQRSLKELAVFVTVYLAPEAADSPKLNLEIKQGGRVLGQANYDLPAPDAARRIKYAGSLAIDRLQAGEYELRVTVRDAKTTATRSQQFAIMP
jgi:VWFA-related protein